MSNDSGSRERKERASILIAAQGSRNDGRMVVGGEARSWREAQCCPHPSMDDGEEQAVNAVLNGVRCD